jgi:hypothetical protein
MKKVPLYAVLSGFEPGKIPGASTLRDFCDRLWDYEDRQQRRKQRKKPRKLRRKPTKKYKKGEKQPPRHPGIVARLAERFTKGRSAARHSEDILNQVLKACFVFPSAEQGLLGDPQQLTISGDGSQYASGANPLGRKTCDCRKKGIFRCECARTFPDPHASWGWDSYRGRYIYGYAAYELTSVGGGHDLPCYILFAACQRHDAVSGLVALDKFFQLYPELRLLYFLADAAHDALPIYQYVLSHGAQPIIDINKRSLGAKQLRGDITIDALGRPICPEGLAMLFDGACPSRNRFKWVCPLAKRGKHTPKCACTDSPYGRTTYTKPEDDPRLFTQPPRGSAEWKKLYAKRSGSERSNSRKKTDLNIAHTRIRSKHRRCIQIAMAGMVQHLNAWFKQAEQGQGFAASILEQVTQILPIAA